MPIFSNAPRRRIYTVPDAAAAAEAVPAAAQAPVPEARPSRPPRPTRQLRPFAACFGVSGQPGFTQPAGNPAPVSPRVRKAQLDAALDRWAATQSGTSRVEVFAELKKTLGCANPTSISEMQEPPRLLDLFSKNLTSIPAEMGQAKELHTLGLRNNRLTGLPPEMAQAKSLHTLDLSYNQLTSIPAEMAHAESLHTFDLSDNRLTSIPAEMGQSKSLHVLNLSFNRLKSIPAEMAQVETLHTLDLSHNQLKGIPAEMAHAKSLHTLILKSSGLTSFPDKMGQSKSLHTLDLTFNPLKKFPAKLAQAESLHTLILVLTGLTSFPAKMAQAKSLHTLDLSENPLTSFPAEMGQSQSLHTLILRGTALTSFPAEMGHAQSLSVLDLGGNRLTSFPAGMGQAKSLHTLGLANNHLTDLPNDIAQLRHLRHLDLQGNQFTQVPRCLLELPAETEINLQYNPLPNAEIMAVRAAMEQRVLAGLTVPQLLLPAIAADVGELREAVANGMNVHTTFLTDAFKKRLDEVAGQFPDNLCGDTHAQRAELAAIEARLMQAMGAETNAASPDPQVLAHAREVAALMFRKGQGEAGEYFNEFDRSAGHVLGYTFLALEAQWARTPEAHQSEARRNGMTALITALDSGSGMCDTRLCEEVMQTIGLPLSNYAEMNKEITGVAPPAITTAEMRDVTFAVAKSVLQEMLEQNPTLASDAPPEGWHAAVAERMQRDHPRISPEQWEPHVQGIQSEWETFHDLVDEQINARPG